MRVELRVPAAGESITEVQVADWLKRAGDPVRQDEAVVLLETDKAAMELPSPVAGVLAEIVKQKGETAKVGEVLAYVEDAPVGEAPAPKKEAPAAQPTKPTPAARPRKPSPAAQPTTSPAAESPRVMPGARRLMAERGIEADEVAPTGPGGRLLKEDVVRHLDQAREPAGAAAPVGPEAAAPATAAPAAAAPTSPRPGAGSRVAAAREEEAVPMSPLRRRVAERLVQAQQTAALLTTFNEIDMSAVMALRRAHQEAFQQRHGVKLGFMSFFVKTVIEALKQCPELNGEIRGTDIVYRNYFDVGIAVGGGRGLVVPVLRHAERLSFAEIERAIADFAGRAQANKRLPVVVEYKLAVPVAEHAALAIPRDVGKGHRRITGLVLVVAPAVHDQLPVAMQVDEKRYLWMLVEQRRHIACLGLGERARPDVDLGIARLG